MELDQLVFWRSVGTDVRVDTTSVRSRPSCDSEQHRRQTYGDACAFFLNAANFLGPPISASRHDFQALSVRNGDVARGQSFSVPLGIPNLEMAAVHIRPFAVFRLACQFSSARAQSPQILVRERTFSKATVPYP